jgi:catechol 2,3-dioxygenase-like lactoylglutathione lyase family enzyme
MITGLDHLVILVEELERAVAGYEELGFRVTPGGEHANGATGISRLLIAAPWNVDKARRILTALADTSPQGWDGVVGLGSQEIHVLSVAPDPPQSSGGPLAVQLRTAGGERTELDAALAQGVRILLNWA